MNIRRFFITLSLSASVAFSVKAQTIAPFKAGDRVVFLGTSITAGGMYHSYIWLYYITHFPEMRFRCFNAGIGADNVAQEGNRYDDDVMLLKPTVLTTEWGMNDTGYFEWGKGDTAETKAKFVASAIKNYQVLGKKLAETQGVKRIILLGPPYDQTTTSNPRNLYKGKAGALGALVDFQADEAKRNHYGLVDFYHPMLAIDLREQQRDPLFSLAPNDRVHPDCNGHLVMTYEFLKAQGLAGKVVADVVINADNKAVTKSTNATVTNVSKQESGVGFDYLAKSLPYPIDTIPHGNNNKKKQSDALPLIPFMKDFNSELLTVNGLKAGNYNLVMDNEIVCSYTSQQLTDGVNLAEQTYTPEYQQAIQIRELNEERRDMERRFRMYAFMQFDLLKAKGLLYADNRAAMDTVEKSAVKNAFVKDNKGNYLKAQYKTLRDTWNKEMDVLIDEMYTINKPKLHHVQLKFVN